MPFSSPASSTRSPLKVWHLTGLKELWLTNNDIRMLPPQIRELRNLRTLGIGRNRISRCETNQFTQVGIAGVTITGTVRVCFLYKHVPRSISTDGQFRHESHPIFGRVPTSVTTDDKKSTCNRWCFVSETNVLESRVAPCPEIENAPPYWGARQIGIYM